MGLDATPRSAWLASHAPGAWLASPRVRLLAALAVAYLLGVWSATSSSAGVAQGAAAAVVACASGPGAESAAAEALGDSAAQPIVDDAALVPVTEEDVMAVEAAEQPEPTAEPAEPAEPVGAPAAAPAAAVAPRHVAPPRKSVVKLRGTITCSALRALRARFIAYLTVPNMVPGIKTAVMNIIGQLDAEVLLPLIGDLCVCRTGRRGGWGAFRGRERMTGLGSPSLRCAVTAPRPPRAPCTARARAGSTAPRAS